MVERICLNCRFANPVDAHYCNKCGAALERQLPAPPEESTALAQIGRNLPVRWKQVGASLAVGVAALAAEAGMAWLRKRIEAPTVAPSSNLVPPAASGAPKKPASIITIISERIIEQTFDQQGRRTVERSFWRKIEE